MAAAGTPNATVEVIAYEKSGKPVLIVYDTWTPRPHFILVQRQPKADASDDELQAAYELIGDFLHAYPKFDAEAILSFHRGKWYQQHTSKWHAHLYVSKQPYLEEARTKITRIPKNKEWGNVTTVEAGMQNWHTRKVNDYNKYKNECIQRGISGLRSLDNHPLSKFDSNSQYLQLVWTYPAPRIGIIARSPTNVTLNSLYTFMSEVRSDMEAALRKSDTAFTNFGCHLCLYIRGQPNSTFVTCRPGQVLSENGQITENSNIVGYIQMDESQYVQWLPIPLKKVWLDGFRQAEHFVQT